MNLEFIALANAWSRPLHGVPILLKDNIVSLEGFSATSGSYLLLGTRSPRESPVVIRLKKAGAVILGSANLSEWTNFRTGSPNWGWSPRGGQTYGAYFDMMGPSGSSSGSAVATDVGLCVVAIGTEVSVECREGYNPFCGVGTS